MDAATVRAIRKIIRVELARLEEERRSVPRYSPGWHAAKGGERSLRNVLHDIRFMEGE